MSPSSGALLPHTNLTRNIALRNAIERWHERHGMHLRRADIEMEARPIPAGSYKTVYRGSLRISVSGGDSREVTVAVVKMRHGDVTTEARMLLKICRHPRIVRFMGQCVEGNEQLLLMEFAAHGSLSEAMETLEGKTRLRIAWS